jgi:hypothetical protein
MALDLTKQERETLHNRFHAQKHRAKSLGIPFFWDKDKGFTEFLLRLADIAPSDFSPNRYWVRFDKEIIAEHNGYVPQALKIVPVKSALTKQRLGVKQERRQSRKEVLLSNWQLGKLLEVSAALSQILLEREGTMDELMNEALLRANAKDLFLEE